MDILWKTDGNSLTKPVEPTCKHYFSYEGKDLGGWGEPMKRLG